MKSKVERRARDYARHYGFKLRRIPYSVRHPNGYIRITAPDGRTFVAKDMVDAWDVMAIHRVKEAIV